MNSKLTTADNELCPQIAAARLDEAWVWLCHSRENAPDNADIWSLRQQWSQKRDALLADLTGGRYRLTPMLLTPKNGKKKERLALWSARDALVLKWVALCIAPGLSIPARCEHVKGHGGGPSSVTRMSQAIATQAYPWVCRTDVKGYYGSINKQRLLECVFRQIKHPVLQDLLRQYVHYTVEDGGEFHTPEKGIARGCALSPLMGALYLAVMDDHFSRQAGIYYARYKDDVVILAKTRWQLRRHVRSLNQFFNAGDVEQHPDKTFIGRTQRGFDWMGAQMGERGVEGIAQRARSNHRERLRRLYERFRGRPAEGRLRLSAYRRRWNIWAMALTTAIIVLPAPASAGFTMNNSTAASPTNPAGMSYDVTSTYSSSSTTRSFYQGSWSQAMGVGAPVAVAGGTLLSYRIHSSGCAVTIKSSNSDSYTYNIPAVYDGGIVPEATGKILHAAPSLLISDAVITATVGNNYLSAATIASRANIVSDMSPCRPTQIDVYVQPGAPGQAVTVTPQSFGLALATDGTTAAVVVPYMWTNTQPVPVTVPPTCNFAQNSNTTQLGPIKNVSASDIENIPVPTINIQVVCTGDPNNGIAGTARIYGSSTTRSSQYTDLATFDNEPSLGISLRPPATDPVGTTRTAANVSSGGRFILGTTNTDKLWWQWNLAAKPAGGTYLLPAYPLTPQLRTLGSNWGKDYTQDLTATITLNLVTE